MTMRPEIRAAAAAALVVGTMPAMAFYDYFDRGFIPPQHWTGEENVPVRGSHAEVLRATVDGQLRMQCKGFADNDSNTGASTLRNALIARPTGNVVGMQATITPRLAVASACSGNPTPTVIRARLFGYYFNAGPARPNSNLNDVFAMMQISRSSVSIDPPDVLSVTGVAGRCLNDDCSSTQTLATVNLGTMNKDQTVELSVDWSRQRHLFEFGRRNYWSAVWHYGYVAYDLSDESPATIPTKRVEVSSQIAHCMPVRASANGIFDFPLVILREADTLAPH